MEATGAVLRRTPAISGIGIRPGDAGDSLFSGVRRTVRISARPRGLAGGCGGGFSDEGHLKYYTSPAMCVLRKKEDKRRAKLVKGLVRDLEAFYSMGYGVEAGDGLAGEVKGKMISEAAEILLAQLKQLRAQEKEMKRKRKEEKKAAKVINGRCADEDTSNLSSESSDSECESSVKMSSLKTAAIPEFKDLTVPTVALECMQENTWTLRHGLECRGNGIPLDKIEVCMGGKCKKSGAVQLLEGFKRKIGIEGAVVGCKCMGKCRDGPNVRVLSSQSTEEDRLKDVKSPLCIGVGLDDVGTIVSSYFGENGMGLATL